MDACWKKLNRSIFTNFKPSHYHPLGNHEQSNVNPHLILCREDQRTSILLRPGHISTPSSTTTLRIRPLIGRFATAQPSRAIAGRSGHNCISAAAKVVALIPVLLLPSYIFLPFPALSGHAVQTSDEGGGRREWVQRIQWLSSGVDRPEASHTMLYYLWACLA